MSRHEINKLVRMCYIIKNGMCVRIKACIMSLLTQNDDVQGIKVHSYQLAIQHFTHGQFGIYIADLTKEALSSGRREALAQGEKVK